MVRLGFDSLGSMCGWTRRLIDCNAETVPNWHVPAPSNREAIASRLEAIAIRFLQVFSVRFSEVPQVLIED